MRKAPAPDQALEERIRAVLRADQPRGSGPEPAGLRSSGSSKPEGRQPAAPARGALATEETEAPATEAPATKAPETEALAIETPETEAPETGPSVSGWVPEDPSIGWARRLGRPGAELVPESRGRAGPSGSGAAPEGESPGRHRVDAPAVVTIPGVLRGLRSGVRLRTVAGLAALILLAAVVFGIRVVAAERAASPTPVTPSRGGLVGRTVPSGFAGVAGAEASSVLASAQEGQEGQEGQGVQGAQGPQGAQQAQGGASARQVVVHVAGRVAKPGVVVLGEGSRVVDALAAAGGALPDAQLDRVNLARAVVDGEQVLVPAPGESVPAAPNVGSAAGSAAGAGAGAAVNLNTADLATLDTLPGVGPVLAQRILDWRAQHGRFTSVDELGEVSGIGEKLLAQLASKVTV